MRAPTTVLGRIRLAIAGTFFLIGSAGTLFGGLGLMVAWLPHGADPDRSRAHGAAMLAVASAPIVAVGLGFLLIAAIAWPRKSSKGDNDASARS